LVVEHQWALYNVPRQTKLDEVAYHCYKPNNNTLNLPEDHILVAEVAIIDGSNKIPLATQETLGQRIICYSTGGNPGDYRLTDMAPKQFMIQSQSTDKEQLRLVDIEPRLEVID
jgi:hypothetical protein